MHVNLLLSWRVGYGQFSTQLAGPHPTLPDPVTPGAQSTCRRRLAAPAGLAWAEAGLAPVWGHFSSLFLLLLLATPGLSPVPPPLEAALQKAVLLGTLGPNFGIEPKFTLVSPRNVDFAIKSWSSCDTRGLGGKSQAGHI